MKEKLEHIEVMQKHASGTQAKRDVLFLFTGYAPFGRYEVYIKNELQILSKNFLKIYIFPADSSKGEKWELPENIEVVKIEKDSPVSKSEVWGKYGSQILSAMAAGLASRGNLGSKLSRFREELSWIVDAARRAIRLEKWAIEHGFDFRNLSLYSNWFVGWADSLSLMKASGVIDSFLCRAHGYDLYPQRRPWGYIFFRPFHLRMVDRVICISQAGMDFLQENYPAFKDKISRSYLGVFDRGLSILRDPEEIRVLSCSNMIPLKRIHRIMAILKELDRPVHWVHFGSGALEEELRQQASELPEHISWEFPGRLPNDELLAWYRDNHIDFLINVSESEGLPVSIMEAISMGIPSVATDVGGTREIVRSDTGLLIPADFDDKEVANQILEKIEIWRNPWYRESTRIFWKENFNAEENFKNFIQTLKQL
ncbi:MAG: glycosyltransferase [Bacteroidia bacterium]|nr:glycosyltransferase [Bacteroidia bacterium]